MQYKKVIPIKLPTASPQLCCYQTAGYVFDPKLYQQPDIPKPEKGVPCFDPIFGTKIIRISDSKIDMLRPWGKRNYGYFDEYDMCGSDDAYKKHWHLMPENILIFNNGVYPKMLRFIETKLIPYFLI